MPDLGLYDDMDALLSPAEPRSDAAMTVAIRAEAALAADRKLEADIKANAVARSMAMCRATGMDSFLRKKIMEQIRFDIDNAPDREYVTDFMDAMPSNLEVAFAQHLGWVPKMVSKPPLPCESLQTPPSYSRVPALL